MKKMFGKTIMPLLVFALVFSFVVGCGGNQATPTAAADTSGNATADTSGGGDVASDAFTKFDPPVTLQIFTGSQGNPFPVGTQNDPVAKAIEDRLGIIMNIDTNVSNDRMAALSASGDLGDYFQVGMVPGEIHKQTIKRMSDNGLVLGLKGLMDQYAPNLKKLEKQVAFWIEQFGFGKDDFYMAPGMVGPYAGGQTTIGVVFRYDYYEEIGSPDINSAESWLDAVEKMVNNHPTNHAGQKTYGFAFFPEWGFEAQVNHLAKILAAFDGKGMEPDYGNAAYFQTEGRVSDHYADPDSYFWQAMKFYNQAFQRGLLDPDYLTNTWDSIVEKSNANRVLSNIWTWSYGTINSELEAEVTAYCTIPLKVPNYPIGDAYTMGADYMSYAIPASAKNPEASMRLMDFFFSEEGTFLLTNGLEGEHWEYKNGAYNWTDKMVEMFRSDTNVALETGIGKYGNLRGLSNGYIMSSTGLNMVIPLGREDWSEFAKKYCDIYGINNMGDVYVNVPINSQDLTFASLINPTPDDINEIFIDIYAYCAVEVPLLLGSANDAVFEAGKAAIIERIKSMGYDEWWAFNYDNFMQAIAQVDKYLN